MDRSKWLCEQSPPSYHTTYADAAQTAEPILNKLDPFNFFITHRLFRESTSSISVAPIPWLPFLKLGRKVVKDLSYLNR